MELNEVTKGKYLKPFLALIKELYRKHVDLPPKENMRQKLSGYFPYYDEVSLNFVIDKTYEYIRSGMAGERHTALSRLFNFFYYNKYGPETEKIHSPDLYHFCKKEFLSTVLKNKFIYPTVVGFNEYKSLLRSYQGGLGTVKDVLISNRQLQETWSASEKTFRKLNSESAKMKKYESFLESDSFLPAVTCFTELSSDQIGLHSDHYGSYGIQFKKSALVINEYFFDTPDKTPHHIRPIYYCDNSRCSMPWLILKRVSEILDSEEDRDELKKLMVDLALLKPIDQTLLSPKNVFSVMFEREWRFVSFERLFSFKQNDIWRVLVSKTDYQRFLEGQKDDELVKIIEYCTKHKILLEYV